ncbi:hypothetical protein ACFQ4O_06110 [Methylopila musalis]|uniref:Tail fiber protein n=1 Tax=Methylopila musalis TaxID=1134781 RepID=A0ABW3Z5N7_9HYPH
MDPEDRIALLIPTIEDYRQPGWTDQQAYDAAKIDRPGKLLDLAGQTITLSALPNVYLGNVNYTGFDAPALYNGFVSVGGVVYPMSGWGAVSSANNEFPGFADPKNETPLRVFAAASESFAFDKANGRCFSFISSSRARGRSRYSAIIASAQVDSSADTQSLIATSRMCENATERSAIVGGTMCRTLGYNALSAANTAKRWGFNKMWRITNNTGVAQSFPPANSGITYSLDAIPYVIEPGGVTHKTSLDADQKTWLSANGWAYEEIDHNVWPNAPTATGGTFFASGIYNSTGVEVHGSNCAAIATRGFIWSSDDDTVERPSKVYGAGASSIAVQGVSLLGQYALVTASFNVNSVSTTSATQQSYNLVASSGEVDLEGVTRHATVLSSRGAKVRGIRNALIATQDSAAGSTTTSITGASVLSSTTSESRAAFSTVIGSTNVLSSAANSVSLGLRDSVNAGTYSVLMGRGGELVDGYTLAGAYSTTTDRTPTGANRNITWRISHQTGVASFKGLNATNFPGPFANDAAAATGGVAVKSVYLKSDGTLAWRVA